MEHLRTEANYRGERGRVYPGTRSPRNRRKPDPALPVRVFTLLRIAMAWRRRRRWIMAVASSP